MSSEPTTRRRETVMRTRILLLGALTLGAAAAVPLRYQFRPGLALTYDETFSAQGTMSLQFGEEQQALPLQIETRDRRTLTAGQPERDGTVWVESRSDGANISFSVLGQQQQQRGPATRFRLRMNLLGDVLEVGRLDAPPVAGSMVDLALSTVGQLLGVVGFPEHDVQVGGTWDKELPVRGQDGRRLTARTSNRLEELAAGEAGPLARISTRFEVPIPRSEGTMELGGMQLPIAMQGTYVGDSTTWWDVGAGRTQSTATRGTMKFALELGAGAGLPMDPAQVELRVQVGTELAR